MHFAHSETYTHRPSAADDTVGARYHLGLTALRIIAQSYFDPASEELRYLPEGPRVLRNHPGGGALLGWVAIQHSADLHQGSINVLDLASCQNRSFPLPGRPGFFAETIRPGVVLIGLERRLVYFNLLTGDLEDPGIQVTGDERVIINDGLAVDGGVLFGTKHLEFNQPIAALYFFDSATRRVHTVLGGEICSNGKLLHRHAESATLIEIDSTPKTITRYLLDVRLEHVLEQSLIAAADSLPATPDGLRPSPDGENGPGGESVIVAFYNPAAVADGVAQQRRISDGAVLCEWRFPGSPRVTCPEFVEVEGKVKLLFTTAVEGMPDATRRLAFGAGNMYIADTPFEKMPAPPPLVSM
jgi:sugar lactone lactonase YvrE